MISSRTEILRSFEKSPVQDVLKDILDWMHSGMPARTDGLSYPGQSDPEAFKGKLHDLKRVIVAVKESNDALGRQFVSDQRATEERLQSIRGQRARLQEEIEGQRKLMVNLGRSLGRRIINKIFSREPDIGDWIPHYKTLRKKLDMEKKLEEKESLIVSEEYREIIQDIHDVNTRSADLDEILSALYRLESLLR